MRSGPPGKLRAFSKAASAAFHSLSSVILADPPDQPTSKRNSEDEIKRERVKDLCGSEQDARAAICFQAVCRQAGLFCPGPIAYRLRIGVRRLVASALLIACPFRIVVLSGFAYRRPTASHHFPSWSPWGCRESCWIAQDYRTKAGREGF
jgi:hypothetical protein